MLNTVANTADQNPTARTGGAVPVTSSMPASTPGAGSGISGAMARQTSNAGMPAAARMISGVVPAVEPRILRSKSGFLIALEQTTAETGDDVGKAMAQPIRDAAAGLLFATLDTLHGTIRDPLALFDGRLDPELRRSLIGEACVCVFPLLSFWSSTKYFTLSRPNWVNALSCFAASGPLLRSALVFATTFSRLAATTKPAPS